jgi:hypothetical protein
VVGQGEPQPWWSGLIADAEGANFVNIRSHTILVGVFPVISPVGLSFRSVFGFGMAEFAGRFVLPFEASWGQMVLPGGDYTLNFGTLGAGMCYVEILGVGQGRPGGIFLIREENPASVVQNALVCMQRKGRHMIRTLELPAIGKSVSFSGSGTGKSLKTQGSNVKVSRSGEPV